MNWRTPITMVVLLGVLLGAAYYGWQTIVNPGGADDSASGQKQKPAGCTNKIIIKRGQRVMARDVVVNVYNVGTRTGLAGETLDELVTKGFRRGVADNAPPDIRPVRNVAVLRTHAKLLPQEQLVHNQFNGTVVYRRSQDLAPGIDVIVGNNFIGVDRSAQSFLRVKHRVQTCAAPKNAG